ncbi:MAG: hypothetical protein LDL33_12190 [Desulfomonile sp.]|nr:hypothetical protein [Desulfomonile sp.]
MTSQHNEQSTMNPPSAIRLAWESRGPSDFLELLQKGFKLKITVGKSVRRVLCGRLGMSNEYLDGRINTIFLDGKPVDDVDTAIIKDGATLALSAAMPGFVGAALRKGGYYAAMRKGITHVPEQECAGDEQGFFTLKLYNLVADEMGPFFLSSGIFVEASDLAQFFDTRSPGFWSRCRKIEIDGMEADRNRLLQQRAWTAHEGLVRLTVGKG